MFGPDRIQCRLIEVISPGQRDRALAACGEALEADRVARRHALAAVELDHAAFAVIEHSFIQHPAQHRP